MNNQLKAARRTRGLAIWGLSVLSGVSPSLLTAIEKWGYVPSANTRKRIAEALGLQVEDIWTREETKPTALVGRASEHGTQQELGDQPAAEGSD